MFIHRFDNICTQCECVFKQKEDGAAGTGSFCFLDDRYVGFMWTTDRTASASLSVTGKTYIVARIFLIAVQIFVSCTFCVEWNHVSITSCVFWHSVWGVSNAEFYNSLQQKSYNKLIRPMGKTKNGTSENRMTVKLDMRLSQILEVVGFIYVVNLCTWQCPRYRS